MPATTPTGIQLFTQTDLELAVGGTAVLAQMLDKDGDGIADAALVAAVIAHASSEAMAAIAVQYLPSSIVPPYPDVLVFAAARLGAYYAWALGGAEVIAPEAAGAMRDDALRVFDRIANRQLSLGITTPPATNQAVKVIDRDPNHDQVTQDSLKGSIW